MAYYGSSIHKAAEDGDVHGLRRELAKGVSPNKGVLPNADIHSQGPLHCLCSRGDNAEDRVKCLKALIEAGAFVNGLGGILERTPLHYAAEGSNAKLVAALLEAGADVNSRDGHDETPLTWACNRSDSDVGPALVLIRKGAAVNVGPSGRTPLNYAAGGCMAYSRRRRRRLVPILLRAGAALPARLWGNAYLRKVRAAGGFRTYERNHLNALSAAFLAKFPSLPPEMVRRVVEFAFHVGDY